MKTLIQASLLRLFLVCFTTSLFIGTAEARKAGGRFDRRTKATVNLETSTWSGQQRRLTNGRLNGRITCPTNFLDRSVLVNYKFILVLANPNSADPRDPEVKILSETYRATAYVYAGMTTDFSTQFTLSQDMKEWLSRGWFITAASGVDLLHGSYIKGAEDSVDFVRD
jgi:hypothetical protein